MVYSIVYYVKRGYALCRRLLLVPRDCHLGGMMPCFVILRPIFVFREHLGDLLASRDHPGGPWEQQDGVEVVNNNNKILFDLGMILGVVYVSFGVSFVYRFLNRNFDVWDFQIVVFRMEVMANVDLSRKSRLVNFGMDFSCFGSLWSRFSHVVRFENKPENETIFSERPDPGI
jgi:hypothetical protein